MKILIVHASAGAGHMKAAEAIYDGLQSSTTHDAVLIDALDFTSPLFKRMYRDSYLFLITKVPYLWGGAFLMLDKSWLQPFVRAFRRLYNGINCKPLERYLEQEQFDYIFSTHFMPNEVASALKRKGKIKSKVISCVTDFDIHKIWVGDGVDKYTVASDWTREKAVEIGIPKDSVVTTGIPTNQKFNQHPDVVELKKQLGLKSDVFTVLMATGSFGIGPIEEILEQLQDVQVIVVSGHNQGLYDRLSQKGYPLAKILGLVDNMPELMAVSDVMVTKPGGLSTSEALVSQLPMIFFSAIPGQETNNISVLAEYGVGVKGTTVASIVSEVKRLEGSRDLFLSAVKRTQVVAKPNAVRDIISLID